MKEKLEEKKRKLEGRIRYYERRAEQKYYCVRLKVAGGEGILEVRKKFRHQCWQTAFTWKSAGRVRKRKTN